MKNTNCNSLMLLVLNVLQYTVIYKVFTDLTTILIVPCNSFKQSAL